MASFASLTLLWQGTILDRAWELNPTAHAELVPFGKPTGAGFLLLASALAAAGVGWFRRKFWGWVLGVVVISTQVAADLVNLARGDLLRGSVGVLIAGALLVYLLSRNVRSLFRRESN